MTASPDRDLLPLDALSRLDDAACAALRACLTTAGYTPAYAAELDALAPNPIAQPRLPVVRAHLAHQATPAAVLARLFLYDDAVEAARVREVLGNPLFEALSSSRVITTLQGGSERVRARVLVSPVSDGLFVVSDPLWAGADVAMGPGSGTRFLAQTIPAAAPGAVLDVGCGAGTLALVAAARGATRAVGVDINPRAIAVARFNARLNAQGAVFYEGDLTAPVAAERFDLVVSQPAFVASPDDGSAQATYLHGGRVGDELALRVLAEAGPLLRPSGRALVFFLSPVREGAKLGDRMREAIAGAPCDLAILRTSAPAPALQAMAYAAQGGSALDEGYVARAAGYVSHFERVGVRAVDGLLVLARRHLEGREHPGGRYAITLPMNESGFDSSALDGLLERLDASALPEAALLKARLRTSPRAHVVVEHAGIARGAKKTTALRLEPGALGVSGELGADDLEALREFEAGATVERALAASARSRRVAPEGARAAFVGFARQALVRGWLVPVAAG